MQARRAGSQGLGQVEIVEELLFTRLLISAQAAQRNGGNQLDKMSSGLCAFLKQRNVVIDARIMDAMNHANGLV